MFFVAESSWWCVTWSDLAGGVVAGLIAAAIAWGISRLVRERRDRRDFGSLADEYDVQKKDGSGFDGVVTLRGNGPSLGLSWVLEDGTIATGTLVMNEQSRVTGSASYVHETASGTGWGYLYVQVASPHRDFLLVDGTFTDQRQRQAIASAWVWRRRVRRHLATYHDKG